MSKKEAMLYAYGGMKIYIDNHAMIDIVEDWSDVRSRGRAIRRRKRGFKQNILFRSVPKKQAFVLGDKVFMHEEFYKEFVRRIENGQSVKESYSSDDISLRRWAEGKSEKYNFQQNHLWNSGKVLDNFSRLYYQV